MATAASPVAMSTVRSARGTVEIGFIAARTRSTSPVDIPPSVPPERPVTRRSSPSRVAHDLVVRLRPAPARGLEPVAELDALDRLDAHECCGQTGIEPAITVDVTAEPRRQPVREHLHHAAEGVALALARRRPPRP